MMVLQMHTYAFLYVSDYSIKWFLMEKIGLMYSEKNKRSFLLLWEKGKNENEVKTVGGA